MRKFEHSPVILISGKKGSGKSTLANLIKNYLETSELTKTSFFQKKNPTVKIFNYADALYQVHHAVWDKMVSLGSNLPREEKSRDLLQTLGDFGRVRDPDVWVKLTKKEVFKFFIMHNNTYGLFSDTYRKDKSIAILADVRFPNELFAFEHQSIRIRLECPESVRKERCSVWGNSQHTSETSLDEYVGLIGAQGDEGGEFNFIFNTYEQTPEEILEQLKPYFASVYNVK